KIKKPSKHIILKGESYMNYQSWISIFICTVFLSVSLYGQEQITMRPEEAQEIITSHEAYAYFGPAVCSLINDLPIVKRSMPARSDAIDALCDRIAQGKATAPVVMIEAALND